MTSLRGMSIRNDSGDLIDRSSPLWIVSVDIGGTGSRLRLWSDPRGDESTPPGDVEIVPGPSMRLEGGAISSDAVRAALSPGLAHLHRMVGEAPVEAVAIGLAGYPDLVPDPKHLATELLQHLPARRLVLSGDAVTAHIGALGLQPGVVVSAGTGVVALGTDFVDRWRRVDGWGDLLGDDGGGAWIGVRGLRAALRELDARPGGSGALMARAEEHFGEVRNLPWTIHTSENRAAALAEFAPHVVRAAVEGDSVSAEIVTRAGAHIADTAAAAFPEGMPEEARVVSWAGGLLKGGGEDPPVLLESMQRHLGEIAPDVELVSPLGEPLDGATTLARLAVRTSDRLPHHDQFITTSEGEPR